ncbi:MAG: acetyl-CoA carboxylase biotin carboxyl carrier protein [Clostridium sp.]
MEIKDIVTLIEAVSKNNLTSFVLEENGTKLSLKREKERETVVTAVPAPGFAPVSAAPMMSQPAAAFQVSGASEASGAETPAANAESRDIASGNTVSSPLVGTFYASPSPDAEPFVKTGDRVKKGQVLGIIEAMKLMNEIESEYDGVVEAVLVNNEEVVEYGQPLFRIK